METVLPKLQTQAPSRPRVNVTCIDIARMVGVAPSTVSRVINHSEKVSADTRARVLSAIQATGYRPSVAASSLPRRKHDVVGLVSEMAVDPSSYGPDLIRGISIAISKLGQRLAMDTVQYNDPAEVLERLPLLRSLSIDGLILDTHSIVGDIDAIVAKMRVPYVFVNAPIPRTYNTVMPDDIYVAGLATEYLIERHHRKIAYLPYAERQRHSSQALRMAGYSQTMMRLELPPGPLWNVPTKADGHQIEDYIERVRIYREKGITGVVTYNAPAAALLMRACVMSNVRVPHELSIISCDYDPMNRYTVVPITSLHLDRAEMGDAAVRMLLWRIENDWADAPSVSIQAKLVEMESVHLLTEP